VRGYCGRIRGKERHGDSQTHPCSELQSHRQHGLGAGRRTRHRTRRENEAGKTGVLRSLWKSKNVAGRKFDKLLDYPRDRYAKDRKATQDVASLEFELTSEEAAALAGQFHPDIKVKPKKVTFTTRYKGEDETEVVVTFEDKVEARCQVRCAEDAASKAFATALQQVSVNAVLWEPTAVQGIAAAHAAAAQLGKGRCRQPR
jgi:hypothetical protein